MKHSKIRMRQAIVVAVFIVFCTTAVTAAILAVIDFESLAVGATFGSASGTAPGTLVFTVGKIDVSIDRFRASAGTATYGDATVVPTTSGRGMRVNNVNLRFDLSNLDKRAQVITFEFVDQEGDINVSVNGAAPSVGTIKTPPTIGGGARMFVSATPLAGGGGTSGTILLLGDIREFTFGGQETVIDNVTVHD
jgi:hypothetical protein